MSLQQYTEVTDQTTPPTAGDIETLALFRTFRNTHDTAMRDQIVDRFLHLVQSVARRFSERAASTLVTDSTEMLSRSATSAGVGSRPSSCASCSVARVTLVFSSCTQAGGRINRPRSRR